MAMLLFFWGHCFKHINIEFLRYYFFSGDNLFLIQACEIDKEILFSSLSFFSFYQCISHMWVFLKINQLLGSAKNIYLRLNENNWSLCTLSG